MSENFQQELSTTAFGELSDAEMTPLTQISSQYGLLTNVLIVTDAAASGSNTVVDNKFTCQTGTAADGLASILSLRQLIYRAGQGALARFTALFTPGIALNQQAAGLINSEDTFAFGFIGTAFGIIHASGGVVEHQELTITTPAAGAENATITVDGTGFTVPLTAGTVQHNAFEIANSLNTQVPNYSFTSNDDQVVALALISGAMGSFAFSSGTAVAAWVQLAIGLDPTVDFIPQASWNEDTFDALDSTKGNVYQIQFQYLGFGAIKFFVEDSDTGDLILVHNIRFANGSTTPSVTNPAFRVGWLARNIGNTSNITTSGSSAGVFIEGKVRRDTPPQSESNIQLSVGTTLTNVITFRNRISFGNKVNRVEFFPVLLSLSNEGNKTAIYDFLVNATFGGDLDFVYEDKDTSITEFAKDSVSVSGGQSIASVAIASGASRDITSFNDTEDFDTVLLAGFTITLAARVSSGAAGDQIASLTWQEDK